MTTPGLVSIRPTAELAPQLPPRPGYGKADPAALLKPDPARRGAIRFASAGIGLAGHLCRPPAAPEGERTPGIVMCGPISSVTEATLPHYAERFAEAGYTVLTFDPRGCGESDTAPDRPPWHYDPAEVVHDDANAVHHVMTRAVVDHANVAAVGVCMGGG